MLTRTIAEDEDDEVAGRFDTGMDKPAADAGRFNTPAGRFNTLEDAGDFAFGLNFAIQFSQT